MLFRSATNFTAADIYIYLPIRRESRDRPHFKRGINGNEVTPTTTLARDAKFLNTCREDLWGCPAERAALGGDHSGVFHFERSRAICLISAPNEAYLRGIVRS